MMATVEQSWCYTAGSRTTHLYFRPDRGGGWHRVCDWKEVHFGLLFSTDNAAGRCKRCLNTPCKEAMKWIV